MTIQNIVSNYSRTLVIDYRLIQNRIFYFARQNAKVLSRISLGSKILAITAIFAVLPIYNNSLKNIPVAKAYDTNLKLNTSSAFVLGGNSDKIALSLGESEFSKAQKAKALAKQKPVQKTVATSVAYNDPSDFRLVYKAAAAQFGIPWQLVEAVHQVESGKSGSTQTRSYAGAQGPMQFMPGTWRAYGMDGNGDGVKDANNVVDAIYGAAHLLARSGADAGRIDDALFNYNHAQWYVNKVKDVAYSIGM